MGFGYLVFGAVLATNMIYRSLTALPAVLFFFLGGQLLARYNRPLRTAWYCLLPALPLSLLAFCAEGGRLIGLFPTEDTQMWLSILLPLCDLFLLLFSLFLFRGIAELAVEVDLPLIRLRAVRAAFLSVLSLSLSLLLSLSLPFDWYTKAVAVATVPVLLFRMAAWLFIAFALFSCYRRICLPEDADMKRKKTGIRFLDALREKADRREEEAQAREQAALAELMEERREKYRKKQEEKKKK